MDHIYYLQVDMMVDTNQTKTFEDEMKLFLTTGGFGPRFTGTLTLALKSQTPTNIDVPGPSDVPYPGYALDTVAVSPSPAVATAPGGRTATRYVHLWRLPAIADLDLARVMTAAGDNLTYMKIHGMVLAEAQNVVVYADPSTDTNAILPKPNQLHTKATRTTMFVRKTRRFSPLDIQLWLQGLITIAPLVRANDAKFKSKWCYVGDFQEVTGELNSVSQLWRCDIGGDPRDAARCDADFLAFGKKLSGAPDATSRPLTAPFEAELNSPRPAELFVCPDYFLNLVQPQAVAS